MRYLCLGVLVFFLSLFWFYLVARLLTIGIIRSLIECNILDIGGEHGDEEIEG